MTIILPRIILLLGVSSDLLHPVPTYKVWRNIYGL